MKIWNVSEAIFDNSRAKFNDNIHLRNEFHFSGVHGCHGLTLLNIKSEDTMACCAQQIMYRMTKGIRFLL